MSTQKHPRVQIPGKVFIHDEDHLFIAPLNNVSVGGAFVDKLVALETGKTVRLVIKSPKLSQAIQVKGTIVRVERNQRIGSAVVFSDLSAGARAIIEAQIAEQTGEAVAVA